MTSASPKIGVLVAQLGTPDAPTPAAVRRYLQEFLSDPRVIDYPPILWQVILRGIILNTRPRKSAALYREIWREDGSPLLVYSQQQAAGLQARLGDAYRVVLGMTYGNPSIGQAIRQLEAEGIDRIVVFPMFPQYSSTTTASIYDAVFKAAAGSPRERKRFVPALRMVPPFYQHPAFISAAAAQIQEALDQWDRQPDKIVFSFHGIPSRYVKTGDPYPAQCQITAQALADALQLPPDRWTISYQSRFGPEQWLGPSTSDVLESLPASGASRVAVITPGFVTDCLETLHELRIEGMELFEAGGGQADNYHVAACLNAHPAWLDAMATLVRAECSGWVDIE
jgi:ferrochelatase